MIASPIAHPFLRKKSAARGLVLPVQTGILMYMDANANNSLWKDTSRTIPATTAGDSILGVTDFSGNLRHWSQANSAVAPTLQSIGNIKVLRYDTSGTMYMLFASGMTTIRTSFWVAGESNGWGGGYSFLLGDGGSYDFHSDSPHGCFASYDSRPVNLLRIDKVGVGIGTARPISPAIKVITAQNSGDARASEFSRDRNNAYGTRSWHGDVALLICYNSVFTTQQMSDTEDAIKAYLSI
jgi:hypothetical protein